MQVRADWLQVTRVFTQYVAPGLVVLALTIELSGLSIRSTAYGYLLAIVFSVLTILMIGVCGWIVFLWDIDRLFFTLERKIDAQLPEQTASEEPDGSLLGRAKEMLNSKTQHLRVQAVGAIEKAYWEDINAGGVLAFPQPNIAAAVEQIDKSRRDLLAPLTELVVRAIPMGNAPASIVSRVIFRFVAPDVKLRLYRRLVLRFLSQLGALFALTVFCFYLSILGWSRVNGSVFNQPDVSAVSVLFYQLDLMLRGGLFDFMEHTQRSISPIRINQSATAFVYYTLLFRMFVAVYVLSSLFRVIRFVARRWRVLLR
jgi:hypothetical protein